MIILRTPVTALALALALSVVRPLSAEEPAPSISGTITLQGRPLDGGKIVFYLDDDEFVGGKVKGGAYKLTRVPAGAWRVSIDAMGVPAKYASEKTTGLRVEVRAGTNTLDFDLK
jgi:hypothetical protein